MPSKKELDSKAWEWARETDPDGITQNHVQQAYRLHLKPCKPGHCRRNCKGNPHCLNGIGEREWQGDIPDSKWHDIEDPEDERREQNDFVGLKNLGATCYVNSLLQVWFHNHKFRSVIYEWQDPDSANRKPPCIDPTSSTTTTATDSKYTVLAVESECSDSVCSCQASVDSVPCSKCSPSTALSEVVSTSVSREDVVSSSSSGSPKKRLPNLSNERLDKYMPTSICGRLQLIFGLLQQSNRSYVDPTPFITSLGIDAGQQQDAQEFSKLFISLLEDTLSRDPNPRVSGVIQDQFSGEYDYVTRCGTCLNESRRSSRFYELDLNIKGHKELGECIGEFLKEEKLEGDNQYFCTQCNSKQNAIRKIQLRSLPPVLNLQLLRFVFDRNSGHKKKLNTYIQFPVVLDMSSYLGLPELTMIYDLFAVLLHRGPSAYSGHYVAHINDHNSAAWYKFNDEEIEKMAGRDLQLGNEDDVSDKASKKPKATKGFHCSRNSYMLVYHRRGYVVQDENVEVPGNVMQYVNKDNEQFEEWIVEMTTMREESVNSGKARQQLVNDMYHRFPVAQGGEYDWISSDWLTKWFHDPVKAKEIDNSKVLCCHKRLDPDKVADMKCINKEVANDLYNRYGGNHRLDGSSLCEECVKARCYQIRTEARVDEDSKFISQALKNKTSLSSGYWVCKRSIRSWKKLAKREHPELIPKTSEGAPTSSVDPDIVTLKPEHVNNDEADDNENNLVFNQSLLCEHGGLNSDTKGRIVVSADTWRRLRFYFPHSAQFASDANICDTCQYNDMEDKQTKDLNKMVASDQKAALLELFQHRNRPSWVNDTFVLNVINTNFLEEWKKFIREPSRREVISNVNNSALLCPHGGFMFDPHLIGAEELEDMVTLIKPSEWQTITKYFCCDVEIQVSRITNDNGTSSFVCIPDVCEDCLSARLQEEQRAQLEYSQAVVFVRKVTEPLHLIEQQQSLADSDKDDPEFLQGQGTKKRKKAPPGNDNNGKVMKLDPCGPTRRSSRHKKVRGEKEVKVSSKQTLREFKLQLMTEFGCPPMDQNLMMNSVEMTGDTETLSSLRVLPGTIIYLKVDEPMAEGILIEDIAQANCPEEGFKGTGLMGGT